MDKIIAIFACHKLSYCLMLCPNFIDVKYSKTMKLQGECSLTCPFAYSSSSSPLATEGHLFNMCLCSTHYEHSAFLLMANNLLKSCRVQGNPATAIE